MRPIQVILRTLLATVVLLPAAGCSVAVPAGQAPAVGALKLGDRTAGDEDPGKRTTTVPSAEVGTSPSGGAAPVPGPEASAAPTPASRQLNARPLNRAEQLLAKVNAQPWQTPLPVVVQSDSKDMQCSIDVDAAACHLLTDVAPRPGDIRGQCTGTSEYFGGYAVVTLDGGAQYGLCGTGASPMEAEAVAGPAFPGPWIKDGQTVRLGNMVCERAPGTMTCAHLRTGHGFTIGKDNYELW
jgi:hypothetical protein